MFATLFQRSSLGLDAKLNNLTATGQVGASSRYGLMLSYDPHCASCMTHSAQHTATRDRREGQILYGAVDDGAGVDHDPAPTRYSTRYTWYTVPLTRHQR